MISKSTKHSGRKWRAGGDAVYSMHDLHVVADEMNSIRLALDAAITKVEKTRNSKKEKEKAEAEDEYEVAKSR